MMLTAFPSDKNYKLLFDDKPEDTLIDVIPETAEEELDLFEMLRGLKIADDTMAVD